MTAAISAQAPALAGIAGLTHGFGRRRPGPVEALEATERRVAASLAPDGQLFLMRQIHGGRVVEAPWTERPEADAAVTRRAGCLVGVRSADCLPVLLVDPVRRHAAAAHAGWRGTAAQVGRRAADHLVALGSRARDLVAAIGPGVGVCCYEVGPAVVGAFGGIDSGLFEERGVRPRLNLRLANRRQLEAAGVPTERIEDVDECTVCRGDLYYSHRRDGAESGRMISYVGWRAAGGSERV